jgi:quercetin dioxygenase-like cupin family protein
VATKVKRLADGEGRVLRIFGGEVITFKAGTDDTGGAFTLYQTVLPPQGGPPRHVHHREDEAFYVLEGELLFQVGDQELKAGPGTYLWAPRDIPHTFKNTGSTPAKLLVLITPAGFERFMAEFASLPLDQPPDPQKMKVIGAKYGLEFV